tara:strand:- start:155 stop:496 length:342 start_codon:yes stop_codon:yes gene_type:complete
MYRIVCESYDKYKQDFSGGEQDVRMKCLEPLDLIQSKDLYYLERKKETLKYKKLSDFLWKLQNDLETYKLFSSLLWTLESREIVGKEYNVLTENEFDEMVKVVRMFLKLSYWS